MINLDEINGEIAKLEAQPSTYITIERLAWLYIVRDHLTVSPVSVPAVTGVDIPQGESEFMCNCAGKTINQVMEIIDELMRTLNIVQPALYNAVLKKLV